MNCPECLKDNLKFQLKLTCDIYSCENEECEYIKVAEDMKTFYSTSDEIVYDENSSRDLKNIKSHVKQNRKVIKSKQKMPFTKICPDCLKENKNEHLILIDDLYICKGKNCSYNKNAKEFIKLEKNPINMLDTYFYVNTDKKDPEKDIVDQLPVESKAENVSVVINNAEMDIIDLMDELKDFDQSIFNTSSEITKIIRPKKKKCIDEATIFKLNSIFLQSNNRFFNWIRMPYMMKTHSKILKILLIHLNIFQFHENNVFDDLRREYAVIETLANQYRINEVKPYCYRFLHMLFEAVEKIPNRVLIDKEIDERFESLLKLLMEKYDSTSSLKFNYIIDSFCETCNENRLILRLRDYILSMEKTKTRMKFLDNEISYDVKCSTCSSKMRKSITFTRVPRFVILHFPKGMKEDIMRYDKKISWIGDSEECAQDKTERKDETMEANEDDVEGKENRKENIGTEDRKSEDCTNKLSVVAVVECRAKYPFAEYPEEPMTQELYELKAVLSDTRDRPAYCVHFRNSNGWYDVNGYKKFLSVPSDTLNLGSLSDVRFVVLGTVSDPRTYRTEFSISQVIKNHVTFSRENYRKFFEKTMQVDSKKKKLPIDKSKLKPKRKYRKPKSKNKINELINKQINAIPDINLDSIQLTDQEQSISSNLESIDRFFPDTSSNQVKLEAVLPTTPTNENRKRTLKQMSTTGFSILKPKHCDRLQRQTVSIDDLIDKQSKKRFCNR